MRYYPQVDIVFNFFDASSNYPEASVLIAWSSVFISTAMFFTSFLIFCFRGFMMKKITKILCLAVLLSCTVLSIAGTSAHANQLYDEHESNIDHAVVGTWKRDTWRGVRIYVFREDGTLLWGPPGARRESTWHVENGHVRAFDATNSYIPNRAHGILTVQSRGVSYTYVFYSDATDLYETEDWFL